MPDFGETPGPSGAGRLIALSVRPPWASMITKGGKLVENRSWPTSYRGVLWIHESLPGRQAIVGSVRVADCRPGLAGAWDWVLADAVELRRPVPCRGRLGLWLIPDDVAEQIRAAGGDPE